MAGSSKTVAPPPVSSDRVPVSSPPFCVGCNCATSVLDERPNSARCCWTIPLAPGSSATDAPSILDPTNYSGWALQSLPVFFAGDFLVTASGRFVIKDMDEITEIFSGSSCIHEKPMPNETKSTKTDIQDFKNLL